MIGVSGLTMVGSLMEIGLCLVLMFEEFISLSSIYPIVHPSARTTCSGPAPNYAGQVKTVLFHGCFRTMAKTRGLMVQVVGETIQKHYRFDRIYLTRREDMNMYRTTKRTNKIDVRSGCFWCTFCLLHSDSPPSLA